MSSKFSIFLSVDARYTDLLYYDFFESSWNNCKMNRLFIEGVYMGNVIYRCEGECGDCVYNDILDTSSDNELDLTKLSNKYGVTIEYYGDISNGSFEREHGLLVYGKSNHNSTFEAGGYDIICGDIRPSDTFKSCLVEWFSRGDRDKS